MKYSRNEIVMNNYCDPRFLQDEEVIWKYMDDWKFFRMLQVFADHDLWNGKSNTCYTKRPGQLWFSYPHSFGDTREGTFPAINNDPKKYCDHIIEKRGYGMGQADQFKRTFYSDDSRTLREGIDHMAQICGVSCWHIDDRESAQMWGKFTYNKNAIALKTTVGEVNKAIRQNYSGISFKDIKFLSCEVGYIDYEEYFLEYDGYYGLLSVVDEEHADEKEARFIIDSYRGREVRKSMKIAVSPGEIMNGEIYEQRKNQHREEVSGLARKKYQDMKTSGEEGFYFPLNLLEMKFEIILKANCESSFYDEINEQINSLGLNGASVLCSSQ